MIDTQNDSIQSLNFGQNWFNSIFDSILVSQNSIQVIIEFKINCGDSIQRIIQFNSQGIVDTGCIRINYAVFPTRYRSGPNYWNGPEKVQKLHLSWELLILWVNCATIEIFLGYIFTNSTIQFKIWLIQYKNLNIDSICSSFLAVQNSSIGDLVTD